MGMGGIWELLDGKIWEWDLSFRWEQDGNRNEVIEMGGNWHTFTLKVVVDTVFLETALSTDLHSLFFFNVLN